MNPTPHHPTDATPPEGFNPQKPYTHCQNCAYCTSRTRTSSKTKRTRVTFTCTLAAKRINPLYPKCTLYRRRTP